MEIFETVKSKAEFYKDNELGFWEWLWEYTYNSDILLITLDKVWIEPQSRYDIKYKDLENKYFDLIYKDFKKINDELFISHAKKCKEKIQPKGGTLFFVIQPIFSKDEDVFYYYKHRKKLNIFWGIFAILIILSMVAAYLPALHR